MSFLSTRNIVLYYCVIPSFSVLVETIIEIRGKSIFEDKSYSC